MTARRLPRRARLQFGRLFAWRPRQCAADAGCAHLRCEAAGQQHAVAAGTDREAQLHRDVVDFLLAVLSGDRPGRAAARARLEHEPMAAVDHAGLLVLGLADQHDDRLRPQLRHLAAMGELREALRGLPGDVRPVGRSF